MTSGEKREGLGPPTAGGLRDLAFTLPALRAAYAAGASPAAVIAEVHRRISAAGDPGIFLHLIDRDAAIAAAEALGPFDPARPLWGMPFAVKDNIDVAGCPTTASCPAFAYSAESDAFVVARLRAAGAIPVGKTNLDQFATGLVGLRTPYPVPRNALDPEIVPGGSSSGSAVAVARGLVAFALGTDTAGSGRVPAALNNIVGLKPTLGALSTRGVVPACRTLDAVSILALSVDDAYEVYRAAAGFDEADPYARHVAVAPLGDAPPHLAIGVPDEASRRFFGDALQARAFEATCAGLEDLGARVGPDRLRAVLRGCRAALRRRLGGGAACRARAAARRRPRGRASGGSPDRGRCGGVVGDRRLPRLLPARGAAAAGGAADRGGGPDLRAVDPDLLLGSGPGARSARAERAARHLHQFRQPARALRPDRADPGPRRRPAGQRHPARASRPGRAHRKRRPEARALGRRAG